MVKSRYNQGMVVERSALQEFLASAEMPNSNSQEAREIFSTDQMLRLGRFRDSKFAVEDDEEEESALWNLYCLKKFSGSYLLVSILFGCFWELSLNSFILFIWFLFKTTDGSPWTWPMCYFQFGIFSSAHLIAIHHPMVDLFLIIDLLKTPHMMGKLLRKNKSAARILPRPWQWGTTITGLLDLVLPTLYAWMN